MNMFCVVFILARERRLYRGGQPTNQSACCYAFTIIHVLSAAHTDTTDWRGHDRRRPRRPLLALNGSSNSKMRLVHVGTRYYKPLLN